MADISPAIAARVDSGPRPAWMTKDGWSKTTKILLDQGAMKQTINVNASFNDKYLVGANALKR